MRSTDVVARYEVVSAYWLFSHTKTTGSRHTAARFSDSWNTPWLEAPSPKNATTTVSSPRSFAASAAPQGQRHRRPDDAVGAEDVQVEVRDVHRAAEAPAVACLAAHQLGHHPVHARPLRDAVTVAAVMARDEVPLGQVRAHSGGDRFLSDVAVGGALDLAALEQLRDLLVEAAHARHRSIEAFHLLGGEAGVREGDRGVGRRRGFGGTAGFACHGRGFPGGSCRRRGRSGGDGRRRCDER